jgi:hypothetical protein
MGAPRFRIVIVLVVWVLLGPIGMAFDACGGACDGLSCVASVTAAPGDTSSLSVIVSDLVATSQDRIVAVTLNTLEPPPKSLLRSA